MLRRLLFKPSRIKRRPCKKCYGVLEPRVMLATFTGHTFVVDFVDGRPATVEVNGQSFENPDNTLHLIADTSFVQQFSFRGDDFDMFLSRDSGVVNNVVTLEFAQESGGRFMTGGGNDRVEEDGTFGGGLGTWFVGTELGDDEFNYNGGGGSNQDDRGRITLDLGGGNDRMVYASVGERGFNLDPIGGDGEDTWDVRPGTGPLNLGLSPLDRGELSTRSVVPFHGFEHVVAVDPLNLPAGSISSFDVGGRHGVQLIVQNELTTVFDENWGTPIRLWNFNSIVGDYVASEDQGLVYVLETSYPMSFASFTGVNIGGDFVNGDTSGIGAEVNIDSADVVIISNGSSIDSQAVDVTYEEVSGTIVGDEPLRRNRIRGLAAHDIHLTRVDHTNLVGSNTADDLFHVTRFDSHLLMFGFGGDDGFSIGHDEDGLPRDLALAGKAVAAIGGEGTDFVWTSDIGSNVERTFRIHDHWIYSAGTEGDEFQGIYFEGMEDGYFEFNDLTPIVFMTPSDETQFLVRGPVGADLPQLFALIPPPEGVGNFVDNQDGTFSRWWTDRYRLIYMLPSIP